MYMQQVHKNSILNKFKFSDILYVGQDPRFAQEYAYKQCYLLRRALKDNKAQMKINEFLKMLLKFGVLEKVKREGLNKKVPHVIEYIMLGYAAVEPSWYSIKKRGQYVEAIREALRRAIRLEPKWHFN